MTDRHRIGNGRLSATIRAHGAELISLRDAEGIELLWHGGPEWRRHAPVLFPIVGKLAGDTLRHAGKAYRLPQHGFARDRRFDWVAREATQCRLRLVSDEESKAVFPFAFALDLTYEVADTRLTVTATVTNPGRGPLPFSIGAHPAFRWPLAPGLSKAEHRLSFEAPEPGPVRYLQDGLLGPEEPSLLQGRELPLSPALFARDAVILPGLVSRAVRFAAAGGPALRVAWEGYRDLGLWSKPEGADFLCIEPWYGTASPVGWDGEFDMKPGTLTLAPGESHDFTWSVSPE
ncbi:aldose 1-epimerase family protein [Roseomonas sp. E05]|uniref:aldose 1-epimerase family protein n=1 Tax=Roseomonas sp. E05 TaxID=3046310 RepID=UPI0024BA0400|nr:aldose 1-epimerase family protein [Roseomonas sp. E05]MDJ0387658.1 aldose 1-epimerase family protein [Roseomonas sp. E05]